MLSSAVLNRRQARTAGAMNAAGGSNRFRKDRSDWVGRLSPIGTAKPSLQGNRPYHAACCRRVTAERFWGMEEERVCGRDSRITGVFRKTRHQNVAFGG